MRIDAGTAAVVTGGASGLGRATAEALAASGVQVAIFDLNEERGQEVASAIGGHSPIIFALRTVDTKSRISESGIPTVTP